MPIFGYFIADMHHENSSVCYIIESRFGLSEVSEQIYNEYNGIVYHITNENNLAKILKYGLYSKSKNKKVIHPERIYFTINNDINELSKLGNELYPNSDYVILKVDLNKNNFKCRLFVDPAYSIYGCFTYENINPKCISII